MTARCQARLSLPTAWPPTLATIMSHLARPDPTDAETPSLRSVAIVVAIALFALACAMCTSAEAAAGDPPGRVGRISLINGSADAIVNAAGDWEPATLNTPVVPGSALRTGPQSRAELRIGSVSLHLNANSQMLVQGLDDQALTIVLQAGNLAVNLHTFGAGEHFEVRADDAALFTIGAPGSYHFTHAAALRRFNVKVYEGAGNLSTASTPFALSAGQQAQLDTRSLAVIEQGEAQRTRFDEWAAQRTLRAARLSGSRYVSAEMTGAEDLDEHGTWRTEPGIGAVWYPRAIDAEWAPYRYGRWVWVAPWGWTWVDDAPWGFAPFHYGRWTFLGGRWGWVPGVYVARPVYAPALVGFYGAAPSREVNWVGWFPLAPGEAYRPTFTASVGFVQSMNAAPPGQALVVPGTYRYAHTSFAATAVTRESFGNGQAAAAARVALSPAALSNAAVAATNGVPAPSLIGRGVAATAQPEASGRPTVAMRPGAEPALPPARQAVPAAARTNSAAAEAPHVAREPGRRASGPRAGEPRPVPHPRRLLRPRAALSH